MTAFHDAFGEIARKYKLFLVDQWGVIHNGARAFPGARALLAALKAQGADIIILSNSSKPRPITKAHLSALGFEEGTHYDGVVTSGADVRECLSLKTDGFYQSLKNRFLAIAWDDDRSLTEELSLEEVDTVEEADFIICSGVDEGRKVEDYQKLLKRACVRNLPMICSNPDKFALTPSGYLQACPGAIAARYEEMGGVVRWHGKPHRAIYEGCERLYQKLDKKLVKAESIAIGDSLDHDIKGARDFGIASALIASGVHFQTLCDGKKVKENEARAFFETSNIIPDYCFYEFL